MSYEYRIGKKEEDFIDKIFDTPPVTISDEQELQRLYKNSKFLKTNQFIRESDKERWVFLSHSTKDFHTVRLLRNIMEEEGLYPLMLFLRCMNDEDELDSLIKREIESRTEFILCDSENAKSSRWVQKEVKFIKSLGRICKVINVDNIEQDPVKAKTQIQQLSKETTLIIAFDQEHEHLAYQMYTRLIKYSFKILLAPLYDTFEAKDSYECITGSLSELIGKGFVSVIVGDWISNPEDSTTKGLLSALEMDSMKDTHYLTPVIFEKKVYDLCSANGNTWMALSQSLISVCFTDVRYRVNDVVDSLLTKMLTPSSMIVYIESFRNNRGGRPDLFEAGRLITLLQRTAREDCAGDMAAIAKCYEKGWGHEKNYRTASYYYSKAQEITGVALYQDDISRVQQIIEESQPIKKVPFWKKLITLLKLWFWPFE